MDDKKFTLELTGITRSEYLAASHENIKRLYTWLPAMILVICGAIVIFTENYSAKAVMGPVVIYFVVIAMAEIFLRTNYKDQLGQIDPIYYDFDETGWTIRAGEDSLHFDWKATPQLVKKKEAIFLYNNETNSNLIPRRLLNADQEAQIQVWFKESRSAAKAYEKEMYHQEAMQYRMRHQNDTFMGRGPAWGPNSKWKGFFKRK